MLCGTVVGACAGDWGEEGIGVVRRGIVRIREMIDGIDLASSGRTRDGWGGRFPSLPSNHTRRAVPVREISAGSPCRLHYLLPNASYCAGTCGERVGHFRAVFTATDKHPLRFREGATYPPRSRRVPSRGTEPSVVRSAPRAYVPEYGPGQLPCRNGHPLAGVILFGRWWTRKMADEQVGRERQRMHHDHVPLIRFRTMPRRHSATRGNSWIRYCADANYSNQVSTYKYPVPRFISPLLTIA